MSYITAIDFNNQDTISDVEAGLQLNHQSECDSTVLLEGFEYDLKLCGCTIVHTPDGQTIHGHSALELARAENLCTEAELIAWLCCDRFKLSDEAERNLAGYVVHCNPWFEWVSTLGFESSDCFDQIPAATTRLKAGVEFTPQAG